MHGRRPHRVDWILLAVCAGWIVVEDLAWDAPAPAWVCAGTGLIAVAPMLYARRAPVLAAIGVSAGLVLRCVLDAQSFENAMPLATGLALMYFAAHEAADRRAAVLRGAGAFLPGFLVDTTVEPLAGWNGLSEWILTSAVLVCCWGVGWAVRGRWLEALALRRDRAALERTRETALRSATAEERARIARELRTIVSAATARTRASAEAAGRALARGDAGDADRLLAETQQTTHATVDDLRRLLRVLRSEPRPDPAPAAREDAPGSRAWALARRLTPVLVFAVVGAIETTKGPEGPVAAAVLLGVLPALPLAWRHRRPLATSLLVLALYDLRVAADDVGPLTISVWTLTGMIGWTCALHLTGGRRIAGVALAFAQLEVHLAIAEEVTLSDVIFVTLWPAMAAAAGLWVRHRIDHADRERAARDTALQERTHALEAALAEERRAIAREMHDVVGHALTLLAIHAGAARRYVVRDPAAAREHVDVVRAAAGDAEEELARLLTTIARPLGEDDRELPADAFDLVALARRAGAAVTLDVDAARLPDSVGLAAYRIVQEALTNARKHAPGGAIRVAARDAGGVLKVEIRNGPGRGRAPLAPGGHGLVGMAERVRLFGGDLDAGPDGDGGWTVRAVLPVGHVPEPLPLAGGGVLAATG